MKQVQLKNIVWQEGQHFVAQCLNVDVSSFGETRGEAIKNLTEALELFFEDASANQIMSVSNPEIITTTLACA